MIVLRIVRGLFRAFGLGVKWALMIGGLLILVVVIAAIVALGKASDKSTKNAAKITPAVYRSIRVGDTPRSARRRLGRPEHTSTLTVAGVHSTCWLYGELSAKGTFEFCFANGKLDLKSRL